MSPLSLITMITLINIIETKIFLINLEDDQKRSSYLIYRNYEWFETFECQNNFEQFLANTLSLSIIDNYGKQLYRLQMDKRINIYENIHFNPGKQSINFAESKGFNDFQKLSMLDNNYSKILNNLNGQNQSIIVRATILIDYNLELKEKRILTYTKYQPLLIYLFIIENQNRLHRWILNEWQQQLRYESGAFQSDIVNMINISSDGIYYCVVIYANNMIKIYDNLNFGVNQTSGKGGDYANICSTFDNELYLDGRKHCLISNDTISAAFKTIEFGFSVDGELFLVSMKHKLIYSISKSILIELNQKFKVEKLNFDQFFQCNHPQGGDDHQKSAENNGIKNRIKQFYHKHIRLDSMKPNILNAFIEIMIGIKYFFILAYITYKNYILRTFEMNQWNTLMIKNIGPYNPKDEFGNQWTRIKTKNLIDVDAENKRQFLLFTANHNRHQYPRAGSTTPSI